MVLPTKNFGRHVTWSTARILVIFLSVFFGDSQISDSGVTLIIEDNVFRLYISVDNFLAV